MVKIELVQLQLIHFVIIKTFLRIPLFSPIRFFLRSEIIWYCHSYNFCREIQPDQVGLMLRVAAGKINQIKTLRGIQREGCSKEGKLFYDNMFLCFTRMFVFVACVVIDHQFNLYM